MENNSLVINEKGQTCRKEILITPLEENELIEARDEYNKLIANRENLEDQLNKLDLLIAEFNGVFEETDQESEE